MIHHGHLSGVRAASGSYREKEQRGGGVETKERNKGFGKYQGKKSGWCGVFGKQNKTRALVSLARFRSPKQRVEIPENQGYIFPFVWVINLALHQLAHKTLLY